MCLDYSSLWSFPALSKSDVSIPTWNVFGTLITNLTMDLIHCMETARVSQAVLHVQHMWGKKTERGKGRWIGALAPGSAMRPQLQMYSVFGSTDPTHTKHIDNGPKTRAGLLTPSTNATHPPRDRCTWADDWITREETYKTIRHSNNLLMYSIVRWPALIRASLSANMTRCLRIGLIGGLPL